MPVKRRHALGRLIEDTIAEKGLSDQRVADAARRAGLPISKQRIGQLRDQDPLPSLTPKSLRALAAGLELPLPRVIEAALPSAGLPAPSLPEDWSIEAAIDADPELPIAAKRMLQKMLREARGAQPRPTVGGGGGGWVLPAPHAHGKAARKRLPPEK